MLKPGQLYKVKDGGVGICEAFDVWRKYSATYIRMHSGNENSYDILDKNLKILSECNYCFIESYLEEVNDVRVSDFNQTITVSKKPINLTKSLMSDVVTFFKNMSLTKDDKLLIELGLEDPSGVPTQKGYDLSNEIDYKRNRAEIIKIAQEMKAEEKKK